MKHRMSDVYLGCPSELHRPAAIADFLAPQPIESHVDSVRTMASDIARPRRKGITKNKKRPGRIGTVGELLVVVDLLRRGHEVYRSLTADSPTDLVCLRRGSTRVIRIQVRSRSSNGPFGMDGVTSKDADLVAFVNLRTRVPSITYRTVIRGSLEVDTAQPDMGSLVAEGPA